MIRISSGQLKSIKLSSKLKSSSRPMSEALRQGLFSKLGDIGELTFVDIFAGTGVVGLEAASREASQVVAIEKDKINFKVLNSNYNLTQSKTSTSLQCINAAAEKIIKNPSFDLRFDIVFADPPYKDIPWQTLSMLPKLRQSLRSLIIVSLPNLTYEQKKLIDDYQLQGLKEVGRVVRAGGSILIFK